MSGESAWICRSASCPLRAVPTTRKSGDPSMISPMTRRMKALSSTTSTVARPSARSLEDTISLLEGAYFDPAVGEVEVHAAPIVEARVLGDDRDPRLRERLARRDDVPLADIDPRAVHELAEHARAP